MGKSKTTKKQPSFGDTLLGEGIGYFMILLGFAVLSAVFMYFTYNL